MSGRRRKGRISVIKAAGFALGTYFGMTHGAFSDPQMIVQDPALAVGNLFTSITGFTPSGGFSVQNFSDFWMPVASFWILDYVGKKLLHHPIKLTKDFSLF